MGFSGRFLNCAWEKYILFSGIVVGQLVGSMGAQAQREGPQTMMMMMMMEQLSKFLPKAERAQ